MNKGSAPNNSTDIVRYGTMSTSLVGGSGDTFTSTFTAGTWYVEVLVESSVSGQTESYSWTFEAYAADPDLEAEDLRVEGSTSPRTYAVGESVFITCSVKNSGDGSAASSTLGYYLSTTSTGTSNRIGTDSVGALDPDDSSSESMTYTFTDSDLGTRYFVVKADYNGSISESDDNNNTASFGSFIVAPKPDVVIEDIEVNESTILGTYAVGDRVDIDCYVRNIGGGPAVWLNIEYYIGTHASDTSDYIGDDRTDDIIDAGDRDGEGDSYTFTSSDVGTRYFVIEADTDNEVSETSETNNVTAFGPFTVTSDADLTMQVMPLGAGTTNPSGTTTHDLNESVIISANENEGYRFLNWTGSVANTAITPTTVTMSGDKTVTANFKKTYTLTMNPVAPTGGGTVSPGVGTVIIHDENDPVSIEATEADGYRFIEWIGGVDNPTAKQTTVTMTSNKTVTAVFKKTYQLTMDLTPPGSGTIDPVAGTETRLEDAIVDIEATEANGYRFVEWTGEVANPTAKSTTVTMTEDKTVKAVFQKTYNLTMAISLTGGGTITPTVGTEAHDEDQVVNVTATVNPGYEFVEWTGEVDDPDAEETFVTMDKDQTVTAVFVKVYDLTMAVSPTGGGIVTPEIGTVRHDEDEDITIIATENPGYRFVEWTGGVDDPNAEETFVTMTETKTVTAVFKKTYDMTMAISPTGGGTVTPTAGTDTYDEDEIVPITATENLGYRFVEWTGGVANPTAKSTTVTVTETKTVTAIFQKTYDMTMAISPTGGGTVAPTVGAETYDEDEVVPITASANPGYRFLEWTGGVTDPNAESTTVTMTEDKTATAVFQKTYELDISVSPVNSGTTSPAVGTEVYDESLPVTVTTEAGTGYEFSHWEGDASGTNLSVTVTMDADKAITAVFSPLAEYSLAVGVSPSSSGVTDPTEGLHQYYDGDEVALQTTENLGWRFLEWIVTVSGQDPVTHTESEVDLTITGSINATACFVPSEQTLTTAITPAGGGTVDPSEGDHVYEYGDEVPLLAEASPGYRFDHWEGDASGSDLSTSVTMDGDKSVTAVFVKTYELVIAVTPSSGGSTSPVEDTYIEDTETEVPITAHASPGYRFDYWEGDASGTDLSVTVTMDADKTVTAVFMRTYTLTMGSDPEVGGSTDPITDVYTKDETTVVDIEATPEDGYRFKQWSGGVADSSSPATTVTMTENKTITALFQKTYELTMTVSPDGGGTVTPAVGTETKDEDEIVPLLAEASPGYRFDRWEGDISGTNTSTSVTMDADKSVIAVFVKTYELSISASDPKGAGTDPLLGIHTYDKDQLVAVTVSPQYNFRFLGWEIDGSDAGSEGIIEVLMDADHDLVALLQEECSLTIRPYKVEGGNTDPEYGRHTYDLDEVVTLVALPNEGYRFTKWIGDVSSTDDPLTFVKIDGSQTVMVFFLNTYELTVEIEPAGAGSTGISPGISTYDLGTTVWFKAVANPGYRFSHWEGALTGTSTERSLVISADKYVKAVFVEEHELSISVDPRKGGEVLPAEGAHLYVHNEMVTLIATADDDYEFSHWSGDAVGISPQTTLTMDRDRTAVANFVEKPKLTMQVSPQDGGYVSPYAGTHAYSEGSTVHITAVPRGGYAFDYWQGIETNETAQATTIKMNGDQTVVAYFVPISDATPDPDVDEDEPEDSGNQAGIPDDLIPGTPVIAAVDSAAALCWFLGNVVTDVTFTVSAEWAGTIPARLQYVVNGTPYEIDLTEQPGADLVFSVNNAQLEVPSEDRSLSTSIAGYSLNGELSWSESIDVDVSAYQAVSLPSMLLAMGIDIEEFLSFYDADGDEGMPVVTVDLAMPLPDEWSFTIPKAVPFVGGTYGLENTRKPEVTTTLECDSLAIDGGFGMELTKSGGEWEFVFTLAGDLSLDFDPWDNFSITNGELKLSLSGSASKKWAVTDIAFLKPAANVPFLGKMLKMAYILTGFHASGATTLSFTAEEPGLSWFPGMSLTGNASVGLGMTIGAGVEFSDKFDMSIIGTGTLTLHFDVPGGDGPILVYDHIDLFGKVTAQFVIKFAEWLIATEINYSWSKDISFTQASPAEAFVIQPDNADVVISIRPYVTDGYDNFDGQPVVGVPGLDETVLITNPFPQAEPHVVRTENTLVAVWITDDPARPAGQGTDVMYSLKIDGEAWTAPEAIFHNANAEGQPTLAVDASGNVIAAWCQHKATDLSAEALLTADLFAGLEIVYTTFDPQAMAWSWVLYPATNNSALDQRPTLVENGQGGVFLTWVRNDAGEMLPDAALPDTILWSRWNGQTFDLIGSLSDEDVAAARNCSAFGDRLLYVRQDPQTFDEFKAVLAFDDGALDLWTITSSFGEMRLPRALFLAGEPVVVWIEESGERQELVVAEFGSSPGEYMHYEISSTFTDLSVWQDQEARLQGLATVLSKRVGEEQLWLTVDIEGDLNTRLGTASTEDVRDMAVWSSYEGVGFAYIAELIESAEETINYEGPNLSNPGEIIKKEVTILASSIVGSELRTGWITLRSIAQLFEESDE